MHFVIVTPYFAPAFVYGGPVRSSLGLAKGLREVGHSVLVVTTNANGSVNFSEFRPDQYETYDGIQVLYLQRAGPRSYFWAPQLSRCLNQVLDRTDVAILRGTWTYFNWRAASLLWERRIPYLQYILGTFDPWALNYHRLRKWLYWLFIERRNYTKASGIIALSESEAAQARRLGLTCPISVIPNGVDFAELDYDIPPIEVLYPTLAGRQYILYMGRIHPKKGIERLISAFAALLKRYQDIVLVIAGAGDLRYETALREYIDKCSVGDRVLMAGLVLGAERVALLKSAYMFVLPSFSEGLPMSALEAMACGIPVIVTPQCYLPEVQAEGAGLVVENDPVTLAQAMIQLLDAPDLRSHMAERAYRLARQHYSWRSAAQKVASFAARVMGAQVSPQEE